jgi:hypothetical protein
MVALSTALPKAKISTGAAPTTDALALAFGYKKSSRRVTLHSEMPADLALDFAAPTTDQLSQPRGTAYTFSGDGYLKFTGTTSDQVVLTKLSPAVPWFAVSAAVGFGGSATLDTLKVGVYKDTSNWIMCQVNNATNAWTVSANIGGVDRSAGAQTKAITGLTRIGLSVAGNIIGIWGHNGKVWMQIGRIDFTPHTDLRSFDWTGWYYAMWAYQTNAGTQTIADFRAGPFGGTGLRDIDLITYEDGTPYITNGLMFMTATVGAPGSSSSSTNSIATTHMGIFSYDPTSSELKQCGRMISYRTGNSGTPRYLGDCAGQLIFDRDDDLWRVQVSSWGDYDISPNVVDVYEQTLDTNPLYGTTILRDLANCGFRAAETVAYDPNRVKVAGVWHQTFVRAIIGTNYHRQATTPAGLLTAADVALAAGEGPKFRKLGGVWYTVIGTTTVMKAYKLADDTYYGNLTITFTASMATVPPHPNIVPINAGARTKYQILTFNQALYNDSVGQATNYFSHGDAIVFETSVVAGTEFPFLVSRQ